MRRKKNKPNKFKENQKNNKEANRAMEVKVKPPDQKLQNQKIKQTKRQSKRRKEKNGLTIKDVKLLDRLYSKGPASFGSSKQLKDFSKLQMTKVKMYLETKPSFTKYRAQRLNFPRLKVIVNDLHEIWSLDLAHVDKLAKYNRDVKYLLVAVDCLSRYLRVEPLKTKNATETAKAFQNMIKHKQPQKLGWMMVLSFWELSKHSATNEEFICIVLSAKRSLRLPKETSGHLKIIFTDIWRKNGRILILTIWINS